MVDKHERVIWVCWMEKNIVLPISPMVTISVLQQEMLCEEIPLKFLRNGSAGLISSHCFKLTLVSYFTGMLWFLDIKGFSLSKNLNLSSGGREYQTYISNAFPLRVRSIVKKKKPHYCLSKHKFYSSIILQQLLINPIWAPLLKTMLKIAPLVIPSTLVKRIKVIDKHQKIQEIIDEKFILTEYGGKYQIDWEIWKNRVSRMNDLLQARNAKLETGQIQKQSHQQALIKQEEVVKENKLKKPAATKTRILKPKSAQTVSPSPKNGLQTKVAKEELQIIHKEFNAEIQMQSKEIKYVHQRINYVEHLISEKRREMEIYLSEKRQSNALIIFLALLVALFNIIYLS